MAPELVLEVLGPGAQGGRRLPPRFAWLEIGSGAGINLMSDRSFYELGGVTVGPADAATWLLVVLWSPIEVCCCR